MVSVVILTLNEETEIMTCIESVQWSDDIHILDSGSTDKTIMIAKQYEVYISSNPFLSFGKQRNFAIDMLNIQHEWILFLDADEKVTDEFRDALLNAIKHAKDEIAGFYCCWKMMLEGKWLKRCDNFPKWQFRLLRKGRARFTDYGHGQKEGEVIGKIDYIHEPYIHYGFSKGWYYWFERHNRYSSLEAIARSNFIPIRSIFSNHGSARNMALKYWFTRIPGWPLIRFFYTYVIKFGFLEGISGFIYCSNMGYYEFLIQIKMRELSRKNNQSKNKPNPNLHNPKM